MDAAPQQHVAADRLDDAIAFDPTLAGDPLRLAAALRDLVDDEAGVQQVAASVRLGVPLLVGDGQLRAAVRTVVDGLGLRPEIADRLVRGWDAALGSTSATTDATWRPLADLATGRPTGTGPVGCAVWPDGAVCALTLTYDGLLLATVTANATTTWTLVASPQAPLSRAAVVARLAPDRGVLAWTDTTGVWTRDLARGPDGEFATNEPRLLTSPATGQARYPLALVPAGTGETDVLWTVDRRTLLVVSQRAGGAPRTRTVDSPCDGTERLVGLDTAPATPASSWVLARTDRGRLAVARWDVGASDHDGWRTIDAPDALTDFAIVTLSTGPSLLATTQRGTAMTADVRQAYAGQVDWARMPVPTPLGEVRSLAADAAGDLAWAVVGRDDGLVRLRVQRYDDRAECTESHLV